MLAYLALGAFHGLNPAMGWLFAVALGMQERRRARVVWAVVPIVVGHLVSVAVIVAVVGVARAFLDPAVVRGVGAGALVAFGLYKLRGVRTHPRWVGMRVGFADLTLWSFLMSSAHGAGLMLLPVLVHQSAATVAATAHVARMAMPVAAAAPGAVLLAQGIIAVAVHTFAFAAVTIALALLVFEVLGLGLLRVMWVNLDALWAGALIVAGVMTFVLG